MKKLLLIILALLLVTVSFTACADGKKPTDTDTAKDTETAEPAETETETETETAVSAETETTASDTTSKPKTPYVPHKTDLDFHEEDYELTFFDDFDGTELDETKWSYCPDWERGNVGGRWDKSMISLDGKGNLVVTSDYIEHEEGYVTPISGAIRSMGKFEQCKGYFEIRCKLQSARGFWFAFWLMCEGEKNTSDGIINGAEMDIVEAFDVDAGLVNHALHWDGYGSELKSISRPVEHKNCYDGEYHTFSLLWDDLGYRFFVDGELSTKVIKGEREFPGICEVPTYLKITSEFGTWSSYYDTKELPDSVLVDYVKVYAKK